MKHPQKRVQGTIWRHGSFRLTLLWWIESWFEAVEKLIKAQFPVCVLIRELNQGVNTQAPVGGEDSYLKFPCFSFN